MKKISHTNQKINKKQTKTTNFGNNRKPNMHTILHLILRHTQSKFFQRVTVSRHLQIRWLHWTQVAAPLKDEIYSVVAVVCFHLLLGLLSLHLCFRWSSFKTLKADILSAGCHLNFHLLQNRYTDFLSLASKWQVKQTWFWINIIRATERIKARIFFFRAVRLNFGGKVSEKKRKGKKGSDGEKEKENIRKKNVWWELVVFGELFIEQFFGWFCENTPRLFQWCFNWI